MLIYYLKGSYVVISDPSANFSSKFANGGGGGGLKGATYPSLGIH